jgi:predicted RecB family nuclease
MNVLDGRLVSSATDLNNQLACAHLVSLERRAALGELRRPQRNATAALIAAKGLAHERRHLELLRARHTDVVEIDQAGTSLAAVERAAAGTIAAMERGASAIYQGTFFDGAFVGRADFLMRVERPSARWPWSYEVTDTKLALRDKASVIIQLCAYSESVERIQGSAAEFMEVILGDDRRTRFRVADYAAYYRHVKAAYLRDRDRPDPEPYPLKVAHCSVCDWAPRCEQQREDDDHLGLVAWMRRDHAQKLEQGGLTTVEGLAAATVADRPAGMQDATFTRLRRQAALQVLGRTTGAHHYELLEHAEAAGFGLLPAPSAGDVFFDMEGDPLYEIGVGLEYLFGCYAPGDERPWHAFWGTDRDAEKRAFEACVDFLTERRRRDPAMHVYHYAPYEKTALRTLMQRHQTREDEVDALLRDEVLVDLYAVVRQALMISQPSYSIKKLEPFYGMQRTADVRRGDDSVLKFEEWTAAPERSDILADIERYNEEDCRSTWMLRDWLLGLRAEYGSTRGGVPPFRPARAPGEPCHAEPVPECKSCAERVAEERERAKVTLTERALAARRGDAAAALLGHLLAYHRREERPAWWKYFDRCENVDTLAEFDSEAIGGLTLCRDVAPTPVGKRGKHIYTYAFPDQHHALRDNPHDPLTRKVAGEIVEIDDERGRLRLKRGGTLAEAERVRALIPHGPIVAGPQKAALARIGAAYLDGTLAATAPAAIDLLSRSAPRLRGAAPGARIQPATVSVADVAAVVERLDDSYLFIQGPPGTGKTFTGARVILGLLRDKRVRVGIMAQGHKALHHLLHEIEELPGAAGVVRALHKHSKTNPGSAFVSRAAVPCVAGLDDNDAAENGDYNLISGNAWLFARPGMAGRCDYLFIDEAGQIALADAVAVAPSARNIVLLGDPMQLAQVSQSVHAAGADASVLEHLLGDAATVPEDRGVLLDVSYRMHPAICAFISGAIYDGRLRADPPTALNAVRSGGLTGHGLRYLPVEHAGNGRQSPEEAERIAAEVTRLIGGAFTRKSAIEQPLTQADILIVTPYNAQRTAISGALQRRGFGDVRVGTVDKFQGQEAPVVFYSMATSSGEDLPRNLEFLFEKNRLNVAVSRGQCLSVLVCSPRLLDARCSSPEQVALVSLLCAFVEQAQTIGLEAALLA